MRLTCPNCEAQYEVPDDVIPSEGRDVQCSNCGDTWYQAHSSSAQTAAAESPAEPAAPQDQQPQQDEVEPEPEFDEAEPDEDVDDTTPAPAPEPAYESEPIAETEDDYEEDEALNTPPPASGIARGMDPSVSGILQEEAEREAQLRAAETAGVETQPDLGLESTDGDEASRQARQARNRMARMKGENPALLAAAESGSRRGLLPDIEEINSTLRAGSDPVARPDHLTAEQEPARRKSGFSRGFAIALLLVLGLVMIYTNAPKIAETLPQADPYLSSYVAMVDQARLWLDSTVKGVMSAQ